MSHIQNKLARVSLWLDDQNARDDEVLKQRPGWWHVGKIVFGIGCVGRSVQIALQAASAGRYVLASVFFAGGVYLVYEGFAMLKARRSEPRVLSR